MSAKHEGDTWGKPARSDCILGHWQVEATKFTEVGFHGRDVDQIIRDLVDNAIVMIRQKQRRRLRREVDAAVEKRLLDALCGDSAEGASVVRLTSPFSQSHLAVTEQ